MSETKLCIYTVHVTEVRKYSGTMEVAAENEEEARVQAMEEFQCDWSNSDFIDIVATICGVREP